MVEKEEKKYLEEITFKYIFPKDYNPVFVNGAYGGVSPPGQIVLNFYFERHALPVSQTVQVKENKITKNTLREEPGDLKTSMVRFINGGIILDLTGAKLIHKFLLEQIEKLEERLTPPSSEGMDEGDNL